ncbi:MAG TPA: ABC transporter ATP-binding protein [Solirubrobacteraceae bacterium]|nr:ABC transporter ATP-binding protein [Solirubrobacteraceae bacterium]
MQQSAHSQRVGVPVGVQRLAHVRRAGEVVVTVGGDDLGRPQAHRLVHEPARGGVAAGQAQPAAYPGETAPGVLLDVRDLSVSFATRDGHVQAVDGVSFQLDSGEVLAIVGESGSGKSVCAMSLMGLTRGPNATISGSARFDGRDLIAASEAELRRVRGAQLAMVFQDPQSSLNPVYRVGDQIVEQIRAHEPFVSHAQGMARAVALMERVGIPRAADRVRAYPHELSGGMRQRVMIAMGLSLGAKVLLADEPTTALDVTVQAQILAQLKRLREQEDLSIVLVTHDFGVVADIADRIAVMQTGKIVEQGAAAEILREPKHPYTQGLLEALRPFKKADAPRARGGAALFDLQTVPLPHADGARYAPGVDVAPSQMADAPRAGGGAALLEIDDLRVSYAGRGRRGASIDALDGVSLNVEAGETLAIVGESGSGKTTLLRSIARLIEPTDGAIRLQGQDLAGASRRKLASLRRELGVVFQDPQASLNPRRRVGATLERALRARGLGKAEAQSQAGPLLERVGLREAYATRYPHELSGGERQRVGIARALAGEPRLVLLDEPVSSLDASIRRGVIELLGELQQQLGCAYVLVSHDFATVEALADRVAVMHIGKIVESGTARQVLLAPKHLYTRELIAACPKIPGPVPSPTPEQAPVPTGSSDRL